MGNTDCIYAEMPPCMHKNLLLTIAERGRLSNKSITKS